MQVDMLDGLSELHFSNSAAVHTSACTPASVAASHRSAAVQAHTPAWHAWSDSLLYVCRSYQRSES